MKIEPNIDFYAFLIILGVIQGLILSYFFLNKKNRAHQPNIFVGLLMLTFSLISFDIFLCYTGYMAKLAYLDNFTESLNYAIGPLFYLYVKSTLRGKVPTRQILHLLPLFIYTTYNLLYILQPTSYKYHEYVHAYYPEIEIAPVYPRFDNDPFYLRKYLYEITVLYILVYLINSLIIIVTAFKKEKVSIFIKRYKNLTWLRNFTLSMFFLLLIFIAVKIYFGRDIGDYLVISCVALIIYGTSINVIKSSLFFVEHIGGPTALGKKYAKSSLDEEDKCEILQKLEEGMNKEKYYRNNLISQSQLSKKLLIPSHHISQVINEKLNQSFFEYIANYRIREAEKILSNPGQNHLTIEDIAEAVGYNSKSAFNKTFKKMTGKTPSEYRS